MPEAPLVIAHRGCSAYFPEHTIAAYSLAIEMGADFIEPDICSTKDNQLLVRHENNITFTTNVSSKPEFYSRKTTKIVDGHSHTGWFTEDFTLAEIKTLYCQERIPEIRPGNIKHDGQYQILILQDVIDLAKQKSIETGRVIGIYPEVKHPSYFRSLGFTIEEQLLKVLQQNGLDHKDSACVVQSFEISNLKEFRKKSNVKIVQLINTADEQAYDTIISGKPIGCDHMFTIEGLKEIATYADFIGPFKNAVIPRDENNNLGVPTSLVKDAHSVGLKVHIWTCRPENHFLPADFKNEPKEKSDVYGKAKAEILKFLEAGVDGFFTDASDFGRAAVDEFVARKN